MVGELLLFCEAHCKYHGVEDQRNERHDDLSEDNRLKTLVTTFTALVQLALIDVIEAEWLPIVLFHLNIINERATQPVLRTSRPDFFNISLAVQ